MADVGALADAGADEVASAAAETGSDEAASDRSRDGAATRHPRRKSPPPARTTGRRQYLPRPGGQSFTAGTLVLLASGKAVPISQLKAGDKVLAADTKTGKDQPETVTAVLVHHDTDLYNLTVKTSTGTEVIHTTSNHLFWDPAAAPVGQCRRQLTRAITSALLTATTAYVDGGRVPASTTAGCGTSPSPATTTTTSMWRQLLLRCLSTTAVARISMIFLRQANSPIRRTRAET